MMDRTDRESMEFDVVIIGGGPSGLAAAVRLGQLARESGNELSVCLVEKSSEIGAHILSGAILDPQAFNELFPDWEERGAPLNAPVTADEYYFLLNRKSKVAVPKPIIPAPIHNDGNYAISLGNLCRWMAVQAEKLGIMLLPGFAATEILYNHQGTVVGIATGDMGVDRNGNPKASFQPGYELRAKYTLFAEGCRGHLGKQLIQRFDLQKDSGTQHYAIGIKELWEIPKENHQLGRVQHTLGWPLGRIGGATGGSFLYHLENNQVSLGLIVDLSYRNPYLSPYDEFQRWKHHPLIAEQLTGGMRVAYGARAIVKGGITALPKLCVPGAAIIGDDAGFLNVLKIKGSHTAMKSGMLAAESAHHAISAGETRGILDLKERFRKSWLYDELRSTRNAGPAWHKFGIFFGSAWSFLEHNVFRSKLPLTLKDPVPDHETLKSAKACRPIDYPKPDGILSFDKLTSVAFSNTNHEEDQPCHLALADPEIPVRDNLPLYAEPAQRYCPAGVYEVIEENGTNRFQINAQNCVHCKTCDIKDPAQNITWIAPEGAGGPNYPNM